MRYVQEVWASTLQRNYPQFHMGADEPVLTRTLCARLQKLKPATLKGYFQREVPPEDVMDEETGEFQPTGRTDIQYITDREGHELDLVFEFKKLRHLSAHRSAYIANGMLKFVRGTYSRKHHIGFMVGITTNDAAEAVPALKRSIQNPSKAALLSMIADAKGRLLRPPEKELEGLVDFQTMHGRTLIEAPDIFLGHFFLKIETRAPRPRVDDDLEEPE